MLSSVFVPLYGVILGRLALLGGAVTGNNKPVDWSAALLWLGGIGCYHALAQFAPQFGAALPTLAITFVLAWLTRPAATLALAGGKA